MSTSIYGLNEDQQEMLDIMWALDDEKEFLEWYDLLDEEQQRQSDLLTRLIIMGSLDEQMERQTKYPEAKNILQQFRL